MFWDRKKYLENNPYFTKEDCPFCVISKDEKKLVIFETKYWEVRYNKFPYYWDKQNILAFPKKHRKFTTHLSIEELKDFKKVELFLKNYFWDKSYFSLIRQGTGWRSIEHLHYHYLEWIISYSMEEQYTFKVKVNERHRLL